MQLFIYICVYVLKETQNKPYKETISFMFFFKQDKRIVKLKYVCWSLLTGRNLCKNQAPGGGEGREEIRNEKVLMTISSDVQKH